MNDPVDAIADAVLYEGYSLYPYRPSAPKNRQRWTFGGVFPRDFSLKTGSDPWRLQAECLLQGTPGTHVKARARFLHLTVRELADGDGKPAAALDAGPKFCTAGEEAAPREIDLPEAALHRLLASPIRLRFDFPYRESREEVRRADGGLACTFVRKQAALAGEAVLFAAPQAAPGLYRLHFSIANLTPAPEDQSTRALAQTRAFASTHAILRVADGAFVSSTDPPGAFENAVRDCVNEGCWPVLAGPEGTHDAMLASPIILYDYPKVAPQSPGDLFDGTEIDEILSLRVLAMTEAEKREAACADPRVRALLERTENLTEADMERLHGVLRFPAPFPKPELASIDPGLDLGADEIRVGARVRLKPKPGGDAMDIVLKDKIAVVEAIERDFEDRVHIAVVIEDDPGRDLGLGRFPGHRFFYSRDELERIPDGGQA